MVKWGVLGTAGIARGCTIPGMQKAEGCELYAIAGRSLKKAEDFKQRFGFEKAYEGYDALLNDPGVQAVYIPLPNDIHCEWVIKALKAHKHVLCEKPMAMNEAEMKEMFKASKENGGIAVMTQKKGQRLSSVKIYKAGRFEDEHRFRTKNLPAMGSLPQTGKATQTKLDI